MTLLDVACKYKEVGRLRLGEKDANGYPKRLTDAIRVTSPAPAVVDAFCARYGGERRPWTAPTGPQWEAYLPTTELAIVVLPGSSVSAFWEKWAGQACQRRCDGRTELLTDQPCVCGGTPESRMADKHACKPTTRLLVACPDVDVIGALMLTTRGLVAAETLPQSVAILEAALDRGVMMPATLRVREHVGAGKRYVVPMIEVTGISLAALAAGQAPPSLGPPPPERAALAGALPAAPDALTVKARRARVRRELAALGDAERQRCLDWWKASGLPKSADELDGEDLIAVEDWLEIGREA